jgi:hypothetical protein
MYNDYIRHIFVHLGNKKVKFINNIMIIDVAINISYCVFCIQQLKLDQNDRQK